MCFISIELYMLILAKVLYYKHLTQVLIQYQNIYTIWQQNKIKQYWKWKKQIKEKFSPKTSLQFEQLNLISYILKKEKKVKGFFF